jgi:hypothetical protein
MKTNLIGISGDLGDTVGNILQYLTTSRTYGKSFLEWEKLLSEEPDHGKWYAGYSDWSIKRFDNKRTDIVCLLLGCTRKQLEKDLDKELGEEWVVYKVFTQSYHYNEYEFFNNRELAEKFAFKFHGSDINGRVITIKLTPRLLLQLLDTEAGRDIIHPNLWVNALFVDYKKTNVKLISNYYENNGIKGYIHDSKEVYPKWIITDVKRPNQAQAIKDRGGIVIRVERPKEVVATHQVFLEDNKGDYIKSVIVGGHPSESTIDELRPYSDYVHYGKVLGDYEFDHVIHTDGNIEELIEKVKQLKLV